MEYEHDIFVSYAHGENKRWVPYVEKTFVPLLHGYLELERGPCNIFSDNQIQIGAQWPDVLRNKLARSRILLSLLSANYFHREWCRREMSLMFQREKQLLEVSGENYGLIIPIRLGDGISFPEIVTRLNIYDLKEFAHSDLVPSWPIFPLFAQSVQKLADTITTTLSLVPEQCCETWQGFTGDCFYQDLESKPPLTSGLPRATPK